MELSVDAPVNVQESLVAHFKTLRVCEVGRDAYRATLNAVRGFLRSDCVREVPKTHAPAEPDVCEAGLRYYRVFYLCVGVAAVQISEVGGESALAAWSNVVYTESRVNRRLAYHCMSIKPI